jgi:hypothetical protein
VESRFRRDKQITALQRGVNDRLSNFFANNARLYFKEPQPVMTGLENHLAYRLEKNRFFAAVAGVEMSAPTLKRSFVPDMFIFRKALLLQRLDSSHSILKLVFDSRHVLHSSTKTSCHFISGG